MSRHSEMAEPSSTRWTSSPRSTIVPTCGCRTARTPRPAASPVSRSRFVEQRLPTRLVQVGPRYVAVQAGGGGQHEDERACAALYLSSSRSISGRRVWPGSCRTTGVKPPTAVRR